MKNTEKDERQYSKRVLTVMCNIWIAGAWIGCGMVMMQLAANIIIGMRTGCMVSVDLSAYFGYIGGPMLGGIVGYLVKSALEDKRKRKEEGEHDQY